MLPRQTKDFISQNEATCSVFNLMKHFTIIIYDSRVELTIKLPIFVSRVVIYTRKMFIRLATGVCVVGIIETLPFV